MDWIKSTDKFPIIEERIIISTKDRHRQWCFLLSQLRRPYDSNKKYNELYYEYFNPYSEQWEAIENEFFWMKLEDPLENE
jgi:hypothetical protein